jgi:hypothetical protein
LQKRWQQCIDGGENYFEGDRKHYLWGWILYFLQTQPQKFTDKGCIMFQYLSSQNWKPLTFFERPPFGYYAFKKLTEGILRIF